MQRIPLQDFAQGRGNVGALDHQSALLRLWTLELHPEDSDFHLCAIGKRRLRGDLLPVHNDAVRTAEVGDGHDAFRIHSYFGVETRHAAIGEHEIVLVAAAKFHDRLLDFVCSVGSVGESNDQARHGCSYCGSSRSSIWETLPSST